MKPIVRHPLVLGALLGAATLISGCTLRRERTSLTSLSRGISTTFGEPAVSTSLGGAALTIRISNSRRAMLPDSQRADFGRQVALYVEHQLPDSLPVTTVEVVLDTGPGGDPVTTSHSEMAYALRIRPKGRAESTEPAPEVAYYPFAFACPHRDTVRVRFTPDSAFVLLPRDDTPHRLPRAISASGARYSDGTLTFWNKGDSAFVMQGDSIVIRDCGVVPEGE